MGSACSRVIQGGAAVVPEEEVKVAAATAPTSSTTQCQTPRNYQAKRRGSVSAEPAGGASKAPAEHKVVPKTDEARAKIRTLVRSTLLLKELDEEQEGHIIDAMFERQVAAGEAVIREGEEADNFYVIESGTFAATKGGEAVCSYDGQGCFGELALMYNCPRAASVTAVTAGVLWGVDRATFRSVVVGSAERARQRYEATLKRMSVLQHLSPQQLAAIADCLALEIFQAGEYVLREGDVLDDSAKFYMIEGGEVECFRTFEGRKLAVRRLGPGDVFGEVALLTKAPRQADCVASGRVKCLTMGRDAFERLMGPVEESLAQHIADYNASNRKLSAGDAALAPGIIAVAAAVAAAGGHALTSPAPAQELGDGASVAELAAAMVSGADEQGSAVEGPDAAEAAGAAAAAPPPAAAADATAASGGKRTSDSATTRLSDPGSFRRRPSSRKASGGSLEAESLFPAAASPTFSGENEARLIEDLAPPDDESTPEPSCTLERITEDPAETAAAAAPTLAVEVAEAAAPTGP